MKKYCFKLFIGCFILPVLSLTSLNAQEKSGTIPNDLSVINTTDFEVFKKQMLPFIKEMSAKKVIALGEGTHGTSEFYKIRYWISKILVEDFGFNHIALENDYSDSWLLDAAINKEGADLESLMKKHLLSIWRNKETMEMLEWMRNYNKAHPNKVHIDGIDYVYAKPDADILAQLLLPADDRKLNVLASRMVQYAAYQDQQWEGRNVKGFKMDAATFRTDGKNGLEVIRRIDSLLNTKQDAALKEAAFGFILNLKQAFSIFDPNVNVKEATRDNYMAATAAWIVRKPNDKLIIWAHNAHVSKSPIMNGTVGGMGGYIEQLLPGQYFVMATGTALGGYAATSDRFDTRINIMKPYKLDKPIDGSLEQQLAAMNAPALYFKAPVNGSLSGVLPLRFIGYRPGSDKKTFYNMELSKVYDAYFFIRQSNPAKFIE